MNISVVVPLYNKAEYVVRAIESIINQTFTVSEIIVVDDGSTDDGVKRLLTRFQNEIVLVQQDNLGVSAARNAGVKAANFEFIAFLDADDYWYPHFVENIASLQKQYPDSGMLCTGYEFFRGESLCKLRNPHLPASPGLINDYFAACCNADLPVTASSVCLKRVLLERVGGFPELINIGEDQAVWGEVSCFTSIAYSPVVSVVYDLEASDSTRHFQQRLLISPHVNIFTQLVNENKVPLHMLKSIKHLIHLSVMSCIKNNLIAGKKRQAFQLLISHHWLRWDVYRLFAFASLLLPKGLVARFYSYARTFR